MTFDSVFYSGAITCFVYPSASRTVLLQERAGHLGHSRWKLTLTEIVSLQAFSFVLTAILNSQEGCRCTLVPRLPFPVPRSPFPVLVTSDTKPKILTVSEKHVAVKLILSVAEEKISLSNRTTNMQKIRENELSLCYQTGNVD